MKNILAENMLRFGPKNLDAKTIKKLQQLIEQAAAAAPTTTAPGTAATPAQPAAQPKVANSKIGNVDIPGFLFAEDDSEWLRSQGNKANGQIISNENYSRYLDYYGVAGASSINPDSLIGKFAIIFKRPADSNTWPYEKRNVYPETFQIAKLYKNVTAAKYGFTSIVPSQGVSGLFVRIPGKGSVTGTNASAAVGTRGKGLVNIVKGQSVIGTGENAAFTMVADYFDSVPFEKLDPKYKLTA